MSQKPVFVTEQIQPKTLAIGAYSHGMALSPEAYYEEFKSLLKTAGITPEHERMIKMRRIDAFYFFTKGKLQEITEFCQQHQIENVILSCILTPLQERNLEDVLECRVFSRTELIIDIFRQAAHSAEGKIQVEMAYLDHLKTRLAGRGKELAQQEGFVGSKGPGETEKEKLRRYYAEKLRQARRKLDQLEKTRETQRKQRLKKGIPLVCLVGYTNAGKSSLLNVMTKSNILAEDKLFATLDTTTRELYLGEQSRILLSDTVGFISQLPPQLVAAFQSTLHELHYAHLILHVVDMANPSWQEHIKTVEETLHKLQVKAARLYVFNKKDVAPEEQVERVKGMSEKYEPFVFTHTQSKEGVSNLIEWLASFYKKKEES